MKKTFAAIQVEFRYSERDTSSILLLIIMKYQIKMFSVVTFPFKFLAKYPFYTLLQDIN